MAGKLAKFVRKNCGLLMALLIGIIILNQFYDFRPFASREGFMALANEAPTPSDGGQATKELVYFHMPSCGHCKQFTPTWQEFEEQNSTDIVTRKISSDTQDSNDKALLQSMDIKGFPTVILIDVETKQRIVAFEGERTVASLQEFCQSHSS